MTRDITSIFKKYSTDKNDHGYAKYYQEHLPETATKILEIGILKGDSVRLWHEIYPEAHIFGLDLFIENPIPFQADWVTWIQGSQTDGKLLGHIRAHGPFDFIVEDGSHNSRDQWITFFGLYESSELYVLEDAHTAKEEFYRQDLTFYDTMLGLMDNEAFPFDYELYDDKIAFIY